MPFILILIGIFSALGGLMDWDWFMNNRRARLFVALFGRNGARAFYVLLGVALAGFGGLALTGAVPM